MVVVEDKPGRIDGKTMLLARRDLYNLLAIQLLDVDYTKKKEKRF